MKKILSLILAAILVISMAACQETVQKTDGDIPHSDPETTAPTAPEPTLPEEGFEVGKLAYGKELSIIDGSGLTGETVNPAKTGKVTVLNFWGTWCGPCVSELPHFEELAARYAETVTVVALHSANENRKMNKVTGFLAENYPQPHILFAWEEGPDSMGEYYLQMGGNGYYPYTVILDANGVVTFSQVGMMSYDALKEQVELAGGVESEYPVPPETDPAG